MKSNATLVFVGFIILFVFSALLVYKLGHHDALSRQPTPPPAAIVQIISNVESIKNLGQLLVMKAALKEIVTAERPYHKIPSMPLRTPKKVAIIFKFDVSFTYDLREKNFAITNVGDETVVHLPKVKVETAIKDFFIYDKQAGTAGRFWTTEYDLSKDEENELIQQARKDAERQVDGIRDEYRAQYQSSAESILKLLAERLGSKKIKVEFEE